MQRRLCYSFYEIYGWTTVVSGRLIRLIIIPLSNYEESKTVKQTAINEEILLFSRQQFGGNRTAFSLKIFQKTNDFE